MYMARYLLCPFFCQIANQSSSIMHASKLPDASAAAGAAPVASPAPHTAAAAPAASLAGNAAAVPATLAARRGALCSLCLTRIAQHETELQMPSAALSSPPPPLQDTCTAYNKGRQLQKGGSSPCMSKSLHAQDSNIFSNCIGRYFSAITNTHSYEVQRVHAYPSSHDMHHLVSAEISSSARAKPLSASFSC